jgi:hypothetical protein
MKRHAGRISSLEGVGAPEQDNQDEGTLLYASRILYGNYTTITLIDFYSFIDPCFFQKYIRRQHDEYSSVDLK